MPTPPDDGVTLKFIPWARGNHTLIGLNVLAFLAGSLGWLGETDRRGTALGVFPAVLHGDGPQRLDLQECKLQFMQSRLYRLRARLRAM